MQKYHENQYLSSMDERHCSLFVKGISHNRYRVLAKLNKATHMIFHSIHFFDNFLLTHSKSI